MKLTGCSYPDFDYPNDSITVLGTHIPLPYQEPAITQTEDQEERDCSSFPIPTIALTHPEVVIEYETSPNNNSSANSPTNIPLFLPAARFRPTFGDPIVIPELISGMSFAIDQWTIDIPAGRVDCNDKLDILNGTKTITAKWRIGALSLDVQKITETSANTCVQELNQAVEVQAKKTRTRQKLP